MQIKVFFFFLHLHYCVKKYNKKRRLSKIGWIKFMGLIDETPAWESLKKKKHEITATQQL